MNTNTPSPAAGSAADLPAALRVFLQTGNYQPCLAVLAVPGGRNPLLALQGALRSASTRWERDAIEDIAFRISEGQSRQTTPVPETEELLREVTHSYGEHASRFLARDDIESLAKGLWRLCAPVPSQECLKAVLQVELTRAVNGFVSVKPAHYGDTLTIYNIHCPECGGQSGGSGYVYCPHCLSRVRERVQESLASLFQALPDSGAPDMEQLSRQFLKQFFSDYGCDQCHRRPVRPCSCGREVVIPDDPPPCEGQVLKGRHLASGHDWFCCVQLRED